MSAISQWLYAKASRREKGRVTLLYRCHEFAVFFSEGTQVPRFFKSNGEHANLVQRVLDNIELGEKGEKSFLTMQFPVKIYPETVPVSLGAQRVWGIHRGHKAQEPGLSPFVDQRVSPEQMGFITVEVKRIARGVLLTRAYGGHKSPPLPWMTNRDRRVNVKYWQDNAFLSMSYVMIRPNTMTPYPPSWWFPESAAKQ